MTLQLVYFVYLTYICIFFVYSTFLSDSWVLMSVLVHWELSLPKSNSLYVHTYLANKADSDSEVWDSLLWFLALRERVAHVQKYWLNFPRSWASYDLFRTPNSKFRMWHLGRDLPVLTWDLNAKTWDLLVTCKTMAWSHLSMCLIRTHLSPMPTQ